MFPTLGSQRARLAQSVSQTSPSCRAEVATKNGVPILIRVLAAVESQDSTSADAITSILRMLVPQTDELGCRVRVHHRMDIEGGLLRSEIMES